LSTSIAEPNPTSWTGDAAISFTVGAPRSADLAATQQAQDAGTAPTVGRRIIPYPGVMRVVTIRSFEELQ
jgi:hypothetical protein